MIAAGYGAVVFDLDGTIADTALDIREALVRLSAEHLVVMLSNRSTQVAPLDLESYPKYVEARIRAKNPDFESTVGSLDAWLLKMWPMIREPLEDLPPAAGSAPPLRGRAARRIHPQGPGPLPERP